MAELEVGRTAGGESFTLPPETAVQTMAIHGIRGSGKTVTATVIVEELLKRGVQVVVIDPTDVWWGLKASLDGGEEGFPVVILGGPHGDLPLEETNGQVLADFAVEHRVPMVLSLRHLRKKRQRQLVTDFAEQLYHRKGEAEHRVPLLVVIDEASAFVPQRVTAGEARMVGAIEDLVRRGRAAGLGVCLVDQRPASVNKDVLTQLSVLVCHRITAPQDRKALDEWIRQHDSEGYRDAFLEQLASLPQGSAWFWAPVLDVFDRVQVRMRETFDSSKTPKLGEQPEVPEKIARVDLDSLRESLRETIEEAEANDPDALRARIEELEGKLEEAREDRACECDDIPELLERIQDLEGQVEEWRETALQASAEANELRETKRQGAGLAERLVGLLRNGDAPPASSKEPRERPPPRPTPEPRKKAEAASPAAAPETAADTPREELPAGQHRILDALETLRRIGVGSVSRTNLALFARQSPKSSAYQKHVATLEQAGFVTYPSPGEVALTTGGRARARAAAEITSAEDLHLAWLGYLEDGQARILRVLLERYPEDVDRDELAGLAGQSHRSSVYQKHVATLQQLGAVEYPEPGRVRATELLFPEALVT